MTFYAVCGFLGNIVGINVGVYVYDLHGHRLEIGFAFIIATLPVKCNLKYCAKLCFAQETGGVKITPPVKMYNQNIQMWNALIMMYAV